MNQKQKKAIRDFVDYIVTPIAIALLVIFFVFAASKAWGMGVFERYGIAATRDDITEAVDPIARQVASNETAIASHATQLESLGNLAYLDTLAASDVGAYSTKKVDELLDDKRDKTDLAVYEWTWTPSDPAGGGEGTKFTISGPGFDNPLEFPWDAATSKWKAVGPDNVYISRTATGFHCDSIPYVFAEGFDFSLGAEHTYNIVDGSRLYTITGYTGAPVAGSDTLAKVSQLAGKQDVLTFDSKPKSGSANPVTSEGILSALTSSTVVNRDMRNLKVAGLPASGTGYFVFRTGDNFDWAKAAWDPNRSIWMIGIVGGRFLGLRTTANPEVYEAVLVDLRGTVTHIQDLDFAISDTLSFIYNNVSYTVFGVTDDELAKVSQLPTVPVQSVNGRTGAVVLTGTDIAVSSNDTTKIDAALAGKLGNSGSQTIENGSLTVKGDISLGGSGTRKFMFNSTCGMYYDVRGGVAKGITISNGQGTDVFIPLNDGEENTAALWTDVIAAVQQIAPAWVSGTAYTANALVTYYDVVYRCKAGTVSPHTATPDADTTHWEAKPVSELFLPLTGGTMTGPFKYDIGGVAFKFAYSGGDWQYYIEQTMLGGTAKRIWLPLYDETGTLALAAPNPTAGNLAALDANGNPTDSGIPKSDVITTSSAAWIDITNRLHQLEMQM